MLELWIFLKKQLVLKSKYIASVSLFYVFSLREGYNLVVFYIYIIFKGTIIYQQSLGVLLAK